MDEISISSLLIGLVSGVVSSVLTYFTTRSKIRLDMTVTYDRALHDKRLELYKELWPRTAPLARFTPRFVLTYNIVKGVAEETREWYFREGGIYLSKRSRSPYFLLKERLQQVMDDESRAARPDDPIEGRTCEAILDAASRLRTSLADDIRTRNAPWLAHW
jgi:hypothetical protein